MIIRYEAVKKRHDEIADQRRERRVRREKIAEFIVLLEDGELLSDFDEGLWSVTIQSVLIRSKNELTFTFKDTMMLNWTM